MEFDGGGFYGGRLGHEPKGPCPKCKLFISSGEDKCPHCNHNLTMYDKEQVALYIKTQRAKGIKLGVIFTVLVIGLMTLALM